MASLIDPTKPVAGLATTASVRANFATAASEITALQAGSVPGLAASSGSSLIGFIQAGTGAVARTQQDKDRETISLTDYGVSTSNTGSQNATALGVLLSNFTAGTLTANPILHIPYGQYDLTAVAGANSLSNLTFRGEGKYSSRINWVGANGVPIFKFTNARMVGFEDFGIINTTGNRPSYTIQFDRAAGQVGAAGPTACFAKSVYLTGSGVGIGYTASLDTNNADGYFEDVDMDGCDIGYSFKHSNSILHRIVGGSVANATTAAFSNYMGDGTTQGGQFIAYGVDTGGNATILQLSPTNSHAISLVGHQSESDSAYITTPSSISGTPLRVQIQGGTFKQGGTCDLTFDAASGNLSIVGAEMTAMRTLSIPTAGPRVVIQGGFVQIATISYNSYVHLIDVETAAGAPAYTNLGSGVCRLTHSAGSSVINTTPITTANAVTLPADHNPCDAWILNNGSATNLATLTAGYLGQIITLETFNSNTTLKQTAAAAVNTFRLKGAIDVTPTQFQNVTLRCVQDANSGSVVWHEIGRNF